MSLLILDNYDSFTYNLVELVRQCGYYDIGVLRNDEVNLANLSGFDSIIVSPGPGLPAEAGITMELIRNFSPFKKILGVCLGHQAIAQVSGGNLYQPGSVYHGLQAEVEILDKTEKLFMGIESVFPAGLYHSWAVSDEGLPDCLRITARSKDGVIMGIRHKEFDVRGIQFHPESIMTPMGYRMLSNWLNNS